MSLTGIAHYAVRTPDLEASRRFYVDVLGLRAGYRPPFPFPGAWLYLGEDEASYGVVHLIGEGTGEGLTAYLGARAADQGSGAVDHLAFFARDWPAMRRRLEACGVGFNERTVPQLGLRQVFLLDPTGVVVELNFPASEADA
ncbi:VOC family protein [Phenylobacterium sp.]|uniref:VOC family protein n=1 Tax=Phenylobacterium sp. TaxID=1871053 RepID=UPI0035B1B29D